MTVIVSWFPRMPTLRVGGGDAERREPCVPTEDRGNEWIVTEDRGTEEQVR